MRVRIHEFSVPVFVDMGRICSGIGAFWVSLEDKLGSTIIAKITENRGQCADLCVRIENGAMKLLPDFRYHNQVKGHVATTVV